MKNTLNRSGLPVMRGVFVNVYDVSREYGGPEEGGTYYDRWELVASHRVRGSINSDRAIRQLNALREQYGFTSSHGKRFQARNRVRFIPGYGQACNNGRLPGNRRTERAQRCFSQIGQVDKFEIVLESFRGSNGDNWQPYS